MKKEVLDEEISFDISENTIEEYIQAWEELKKHIKPYHTRHRIHREYYGYDGGFDTYLELYRLETDEEEQWREDI